MKPPDCHHNEKRAFSGQGKALRIALAYVTGTAFSPTCEDVRDTLAHLEAEEFRRGVRDGRVAKGKV